MGEPTKILNKRGYWTCEGLSHLDPLKVWTQSLDPVNGYSFIQPGYFEESGRFNIFSWFISSNAVQDVDKDSYFDTEFYIQQYDEDGNFDIEYTIHLWVLIDSANLSDEDILGALSC